MFVTPKPGVIGIVFNSTKTQVLVIQRRDIPIWVLPGGGIDHGESPEEAVLREIYEETNLHVKIVRKCGQYYPINAWAALTHVYECEYLSGTLNSGDETQNLQFFPLNAFPSPFFPIHQDWIQDALASSCTLFKPIDQITASKIFKFFTQHPFIIFKFFWLKIKNRIPFF